MAEAQASCVGRPTISGRAGPLRCGITAERAGLSGDWPCLLHISERGFDHAELTDDGIRETHERLIVETTDSL